MSTVTLPAMSPEDVARASDRDGKRYELIDGELREKQVGAEALYIALRIAQRFGAAYDPDQGFAFVEVMIYFYNEARRGRKPDVSFVWKHRLPDGRIPKGDLFLAPDVVVEVLSPHNTGVEVQDKLDEYLTAGVASVWIVNPDSRTIRVYRQDGTTRLFRATDAIENEPLLPDFRLAVGDVFPAPPAKG